MPKLTVDFSDRVNDLLQKAADRNGISKVDVLRRAITLYEYVDRNVKPGETFLAIVNYGTPKSITKVTVT